MVTESFDLPLVFHLGATFLFGLTGALAALKRHYDLIGLFTLALVTGVGGGLIRDGLFIQDGPPLVTKNSEYLLVIVAACLVAMFFGERINRLQKAFAFVDALGLAIYAVVGVQMSLQAGLAEAPAVLVGVVNACGGGLLRDILVREEPLVFKPGQFYALAAFVGSGLFALLEIQFKMGAPAAALLTIVITFVFRALAIQFNWKTSPILKIPIEPGSAAGGKTNS